MTVTITTITPLSYDGGYITPLCINDLGQLAGTLNVPQSDYSIGFAANFQYSGLSIARTINGEGEAVGEFDGGGGNTRSKAVFVEDRAETDLPGFTTVASIAYGINDAGQIVGSSLTSNGVEEACLWQNGVISDLGALPSAPTSGSAGKLSVFASRAQAINDAGQIVGTSEGAGFAHACEWQNGVITDLGALDATSDSEAQAINAQGVVVGYNFFANGDTHGFVWQKGVMTDLGSLAGYAESYARSVNLQGIIVGASSDETGDNTRAVLWQNGTILDLNTLLPANSGWVLQSANSINDQNQIAGVGTYNGTDEGFVLTLGGLPSAIIAATPGPAGAVTTGNVTELYAAVLAREPDIAGLNFYQTYLEAHPTTPLLQFAEWFLSSQEYTGNSAHNYAANPAGDAQFIQDSYQNLLHRTPSPAEVTFYESKVLAPAVANLTPGSSAYATAQLQAHALMLVYFSASSEFLNDVQITASHPADSQHWLWLQ